MRGGSARIPFRLPAEQIEAMLVHAAQIAAAQRHAMTVEELENLDRNLAAVVEPIAKQRGGELTVLALGSDVAGNVDHLADRAAQEEVVVRDLVHLSHSAEQFQKTPYIALRNGEKARDISHTWWPEALAVGKQRLDCLPDRLV